MSRIADQPGKRKGIIMNKKRRMSRIASAILICTLIIPNLISAKPGDLSGGHGNKPGQDPQGEAPVFQNVSVHDPSIIQDGGTYYVFGSHIDAAKSTDLLAWTRFTNGYSTPGNALYGDLSANLAGSFAWAGENDSDSRGGFAVWAPDILWNKDFVNPDGSKGAYLMYYSASSTYIRSAIGLASSKTIEGPYTYADTIVYSGFTRDDAYDVNSNVNKQWSNTNIPALIDSGTLADTRPEWFNANGTYNNYLYPNAIDANLVYDTNGKLWMSYGSWSGGIFVLEIDKATGRAIYPGTDGVTEDGRMIDRYFGTKIAGGYYKSGEGPYIVYDKETKYYYLYMTYGWLGADGGYNMRTFRSKNPAGPYLDALGQNAVLPGDTDNAPYGNKLMANYLFDRKVGDPGTGIGVGYVSPGHNSVFYDDKSGKRFLVFHTRFPGAGEMHEVRVHQLFMNEDGWPVPAPYRYAGEKLGKVNNQDIAGMYQFIDHGKDNEAAIRHSSYITLNENHTISGAVQGSWKKTGHQAAEIVIDGETYKGVFVRQWEPTSERYVMAFTAMSGQGITIWGSRLADRTEQDIVNDVAADLNLGDTANVIANLTLPTEGTHGAQIAWATSDSSVVSETGVVTRPEAGLPSATVTLTATITKGSMTREKSFIVTVLPNQAAGLAAHYAFEADLNDATGRYGAGSVTGNRIDNTGGTISYAAGREGQAASFDGASGVRLPNGLIKSHTYSVSLWVQPEALTMFTTTFFGARDNNNWVSLVPSGPVGGQTMVWSGSAWYDGLAGMTIPAQEWTHLAYTVDNGTLKIYVNGEEKFTGTNFPNVFTTTDGSFALGVNWWDTPFKGQLDELRIYEGALSPSEVTQLAGS
jgi:arabinan endo-1,5-alpha-L-arabinosidase